MNIHMYICIYKENRYICIYIYIYIFSDRCILRHHAYL